ncbi:MAG TPA: tetratricopeptide repeat protein [Pyrinomonadaceae bacterium]|nr:tetratricopeptide repeat protein [Acidobacteriota bacterium]HQZ95575.1 tetratricopeptide repeat protein [Pyrinomonadaceae bacterium]
MKKENIMFGVFGLIVGLVVGFVFANSVNKTGIEKASTQSLSVTGAPANPAIPPDHPPVGGSTGDATQTAPTAQVMESIEKAKQQPQNFEAQMTAADLYYQIQRFEDAAKYYEVASKLKPAEAEPIIKAGNAFFDAEKYEIAESWYVRALEKEPKNISVRTDLGLTFFLREPRDIDRAIKEYKVSLGIDPEHEITLQNLALAYSEKGDKESLKTTIEKLKKINPKNPAVIKAEGSL